MDRKGILAAGSFIVDHVKLIECWPPQDSLVNIFSEENSNGGGPYNLSKDVARLFPDEHPFPLAVAGMVGDDADGRWILADCQMAAFEVHRDDVFFRQADPIGSDRAQRRSVVAAADVHGVRAARRDVSCWVVFYPRSASASVTRS